MAGDQDHRPRAIEECEALIELRPHRAVLVQPLRDPEERIDDGVAGDEHTIGRHVLPEERVAGTRSRREVEIGEATDEGAVHLLRPRRVLETGTQARFYVRDRDLLVERRERGDERRRRVSLDEHPVGAKLTEHVGHSAHAARGDVRETLVRLHEVQIEPRLHVEDREHLIEHRSVLRGDADRGFEIGVRL